MRCIVINLLHQTERRRAVEASFAASRPAGWTLEFLAATDAQTGAREAGTLLPAEKGCFLSHLRALESAFNDDGPVWIVEDDILFAKCAFEAVNAALASFRGEVLFTNVGAGSPQDFLALHHWYNSDAFRLIDLQDVQIYGATSYIVTEAAKRYLFSLLKTNTLDTPYDLLLRNLINTRQIKASVTMPFLTDLSQLADKSDIREDRRECVRHAMRRLFFIERDLDAITEAIERIDVGLRDRTAKLVGRLIGARVSEDFISEAMRRSSQH